jgi:HD-GYP domain-containing protein (c-di-GMP phosphodiesterase class II)
MKEEKFTPVTLKALKDCYKDLSFDLFLLMPNGKHLKAFAKETGLDFLRLANYEAKGVQYFYVHPDDATKIDEYLSRSPMLQLMDPKAKPEVKRKAFWAVMEQTLFEAFALGTLTSMNVSKTFEALKSSLTSDGDFIQTITLLLKVCPKDDTFMKHAISTAVYSYVAAQVSGMSSERSMKIVLFASLFHDLGKLKLPEARRNAYQNKSLDEIAEFRSHPALTLETFDGPLPFADEEIRTTILHHRERLDGKGYPYGLKGPAIFSLARIVAIGDALSELTLGMEDGHFYSRAQAVATMMADEGRFDKKILSPFAHIGLQNTFLKAS